MVKNFDLADKVIVVTGGTGVLGKSFVTGIAAANGTVVILGRNEMVAHERALHIKNAGGKAIAIKADVTSNNDLVNAKISY